MYRRAATAYLNAREQTLVYMKPCAIATHP